MKPKKVVLVLTRFSNSGDLEDIPINSIVITMFNVEKLDARLTMLLCVRRISTSTSGTWRR